MGVYSDTHFASLSRTCNSVSRVGSPNAGPKMDRTGSLLAVQYIHTRNDRERERVNVHVHVHT